MVATVAEVAMGSFPYTWVDMTQKLCEMIVPCLTVVVCMMFIPERGLMNVPYYWFKAGRNVVEKAARLLGF